MESSAENPPLIVIVGPTAAGKSALALHIAQKYDGEIIAADSRTIYKGMDTGTAKPSLDERDLVPHHLIDLIAPDELFTAVDFKDQAQACIEDIYRRGKLPILVGGTGLYVDAVLFDFDFRPPGNPERRRYLQTLSVEDLQALLRQEGIPLPENERNPRHLIRRLETGEVTATSRNMRHRTLIIGVDVEREALKMRIRQRVGAMFTAGLEREATQLLKQYGEDCRALQTIGYREFIPYLQGVQSLAEVKDQVVRDTISYAKRQRTWFSRNKGIHWERDQDKVEDLITTFLSK